jgi:hypothetical protein
MYIVMLGKLYSLGLWVSVKEVVKGRCFFPEFVEWGKSLGRFLLLGKHGVLSDASHNEGAAAGERIGVRLQA